MFKWMRTGNRTGRAAITAAAIAGAGIACAQEPRFPQYKLEDTHEGDQRQLAERMMRETRVGLGGPWNIMLRSPQMAVGLVDLYGYFRRSTPLPQPIVELGILITAREAKSPYEWQIHYQLALQQGVSKEVLADLQAGKRPSSMTTEQAVVYDFSIELLRTHFVKDKNYQAARKVLGEQGVVDLAALVGTYVAIGGLLNVAEVGFDAPPGKGPESLRFRRP